MNGPGEGASAPGPAPRRPGRRIVLALVLALVGLVVCVCSGCILFGVFASRRAERLADYDAPPAMDADERDPFYLLVDAARRDAPTHACEALTAAIRDELAERPDAAIVAFHAHLGALLEALDTQGIRSACQAVGAGECESARYAEFRAGVLLLGRAVAEAAVRDADSLARVLPATPGCGDLLWVARAALLAKRETARLAVASPDGGVDGGAEFDGGLGLGAGSRVAADAPIPELPPFDDSTSTRLHAREGLSRLVPKLCHRFTCGPRDLF